MTTKMMRIITTSGAIFFTIFVVLVARPIITMSNGARNLGIQIQLWLLIVVLFIPAVLSWVAVVKIVGKSRRSWAIFLLIVALMLITYFFVNLPSLFTIFKGNNLSTGRPVQIGNKQFLIQNAKRDVLLPLSAEISPLLSSASFTFVSLMTIKKSGNF